MRCEGPGVSTTLGDKPRFAVTVGAVVRALGGEGWSLQEPLGVSYMVDSDGLFDWQPTSTNRVVETDRIRGERPSRLRCALAQAAGCLTVGTRGWGGEEPTLLQPSACEVPRDRAKSARVWKSSSRRPMRGLTWCSKARARWWPVTYATSRSLCSSSTQAKGRPSAWSTRGAVFQWTPSGRS